MARCFPYPPSKCYLGNPKRRLYLWLLVLILTIVMIILALILGLVLGLAGTGHADSISTTVDLGYSKYEGVHGQDGVSHWWGIRYAAPPVKDLRFRAPEDPLSTGDELQPADKHGALCRFSPSQGFNPKHSEDCLFLDVYAPTEKKSGLPVYVYIQGGGLNTLASANMDGSKLVAAAGHDLIVVDFNYRVGPYGFLASKEVKANGDLNAGLLDQRKVLQWVQKHISKFGGDPKRVTLAGSSAGAGSVNVHLTAYGARDDKLFAAVHGESPSFGFVRTIAESQYQYDALVKRVKCDSAEDTLKCLRSLPIETIPDNNPDLITPGGGGGKPIFMWSSCIDGDLIRDQTYKQFAAGKFIRVPSIYGSDTNEGTIFAPHDINSYTALNNFLKNNFPKLTGSQLAQIDHLYPKAEQFPGKGPYFRTAANAYGDMRYVCPSLNISAVFSKAGVERSYNYHWDVLNEKNAKTGNGVTHTAGISPIWGFSGAGSPEAKLSPYIQAYIISFIRTSGDPNMYRKDGAPQWMRFEEASMLRMHFPNDPAEVGMEIVSSKMRVQCAYLSGIGPDIGQ